MPYPSGINSNTGLAFILGALCVVFAVVGYAVFSGEGSVSIEGK